MKVRRLCLEKMYEGLDRGHPKGLPHLLPQNLLG